MITLHQLLKAMIDQDASDLHISVGSSPALRIHGTLVRVKSEELNGEATKEMCYSILTDYQKALLEENKELDLSFGVKNLARFRANLFFQRGTISGVFRRVPYIISTPESLGLSPVVIKWIDKPHGLILVTGPTGSGKSTTLASLIHKINADKRSHIVTIEDPVEFTHHHMKSVVTQRELGPDTHSFANALRAVLRQDPDVILIGELRDLETIRAALTVAETGHLVFGTLHTNSAIQTITRIIQAFPAGEQEQVRLQLSMVLEGIVSQNLVEKNGGGRVLVHEVMVMTAAIRNLIRENKLHQMYSVMQVGQNEHGMNTMNQDLLDLVQRGIITKQTALESSPEQDELLRLFDIPTAEQPRRRKA